MNTEEPGYQVFQEIKWNLQGYPLAHMLREAAPWFPGYVEDLDSF